MILGNGVRSLRKVYHVRKVQITNGVVVFLALHFSTNLAVVETSELMINNILVMKRQRNTSQAEHLSIKYTTSCYISSWLEAN